MIKVSGNKLSFKGKTYDCAVGKNGFAADKKEGDLCSPIGEFPLRKVLYRADKIDKPETGLLIDAIQQDDGWCDAPNHLEYNQLVKLPFSASHEKLWRDDNLYDVVVVIGYNDEPVERNKGSAIFMHIAKPEYTGTEGCIALKKKDLLEILASVDSETKISIRA